MIFTARKNRHHGFTLIELLIVIAILGILAAAVLVAINPVKRQNQARDAQTKGDIGSIATAMQAYFTTNSGSYPSSAEGVNQLQVSQDLKQVPNTPQGGTYSYAVTPGGCAGTPASPCTDMAVWNALLDPLVAGNVWCFRSSTGRASEVALAACTAP